MLHSNFVSVHGRRSGVSIYKNVSANHYLSDLYYASLNYTWINQDRKSVQLPAPTYIDYVMTWVQNLLDDETVFPTKSGTWRHWFSYLHFTYR